MWKKLKNIFLKEKTPPSSINPAVAYIVTITNESIRVEHPKRETESIRWAAIDEIWLVNTDEVPILPDVWLILCGDNKGCSIPQGSRGFEEVYGIISKYENFNFVNFIESMTCTSNQRFLLWERKGNE